MCVSVIVKRHGRGACEGERESENEHEGESENGHEILVLSSFD